jgi:hypothetical protein
MLAIWHLLKEVDEEVHAEINKKREVVWEMKKDIGSWRRARERAVKPVNRV